MPKKLINAYFARLIGNSYKNFGYNTFEEFKEKIEENDKDALHSLLKICIQNNATKIAMNKVILACADACDVTALLIMAENYLYGIDGYKVDRNKAIEIYKKVAYELHEKEGEMHLAFLYYISEDENEHNLGNEMINKLVHEDGELAYLGACLFKNYQIYDKAIEFLKLSRVHRIYQNHDYYYDLDDDGVMYYHYPEIIELYEELEEYDKADEYIERGYKFGVPDCVIIKSYEFMSKKLFKEARECLEDLLRENNPEAIYALGEWYSNKLNSEYDITKANECYKKGRELGFNPIEI